MRTKTPEEIYEDHAPLVQNVIRKVNIALAHGHRSFFQGSGNGATDIPHGYMTEVKSALESAGWLVEVVGARSTFHLEVRGPQEIKAK